MQKITSWSFSRWNVYQDCPLKAKLKFIDRLPEPSSPALERGTQLHKLCEDFLRGVRKTVPRELGMISAELKALKRRKAIPEAEFAFNKNWEPVSWFDREAWCRVKADVVIEPTEENGVVEVDDFKSGGKLQPNGDVVSKDEYPLQLRLYALAGLLMHPMAATARTSLIFIDHGKVIQLEDEFKRADLEKLKKEWVTRTKKMLADTTFKPTPGNGCRWCHFRKANGGPCAF